MVSRAVYCAPEVLKTTNRYNENYGVSKRVHELALKTDDAGYRTPGPLVHTLAARLTKARPAQPMTPLN